VDTLQDVDFFTDAALAGDPYEYFELLRAKGPVVRLPKHGVLAVTGYDEGLAVFHDEERFSAVIAASGPFPPLPFTPDGDDITALIEKHRPEIPLADMIVTMDSPAHTHLKSLLMGILTPRRFKENEVAMRRLADRQIDRFIERGSVEVISEFSLPFTGLVLGDLLGVPEGDFERLPIERPTIAGEVGLGATGNPNNLFGGVEEYFVDQIAQRRQEPRRDVISDLAKIRYADGSLPQAGDLAKILGFLFGAGQGTTSHLIAGALRFLADDLHLQQRVRSDLELLPNFVEECLRLRGSTKTDFRLAKCPATVGDVSVAPGTIVMLVIAAMNRDPRRFEEPCEMRLHRANPRDHVAFGRGIHACAGAPLARAETNVALRRILERTSEIRLDEVAHGPPGARRFQFNPTYLMQGVKELHLQFDKH
jgi:cytochrome P450